MRASDADRERVANVLREAAGDGRLTMDELDERLDAVYAAKTYAELEPITHDLPGAATSQAPVPARAVAADPTRFGGEPSSGGAVAILGGFSRKGEWVVPKHFTAFLFMGGGEIDLRDARFEDREVNINIVAIMGGCEITVPEDANVRVTGVGIMGAFEHSEPGGGSPDGPVITISGVAFMGGVDVKRKPTLQAAREARQRRLDARRDYREQRREMRHGRRDYHNGELE
jgi:Domain of unknown function (DUF1707)/Cell wall-active antibiotics response 4TMS YvqF